MLLVAAGVLLLIAGIVMAAFRTAERGSLSRPHDPSPSAGPQTLEPPGKGKRLSFKADLPSLIVAIIGAAMIAVGSFDLA